MTKNKLETFLKEIADKGIVTKTTPKKITNKFGVRKRGWKVLEEINNLFEKYDLITAPDFDNAYFYGDIEIQPKPKLSINGVVKKAKYSDPIPRLSLLKAANIQKLDIEVGGNNGLISVNKHTSLNEACTLMLKHDFSQLPVLSSKRDVSGIISWKSIGTAISLNKNCKNVSDCMTEVDVLSIEDPIFKAVSVILEKEVVIVKDSNGFISGIVTATDIGVLFHKLSEPFLIIEQIENLIRRLLDSKITFDDLKSVLDTSNYDKEIKSLSDLSFGHYIRIIENKNLFDKLNLNIDRTILQKTLDEVRVVRNDVMHFNPEELDNDDLELLRQALQFLSTIVNTVGV